MSSSVRVYVATIAAIAAGCATIVGSHPPLVVSPSHWYALAAFFILGFLSEASYLSLRVGHGETNASVAFIPFIGSVFLFDTAWAMLVAVVAEFAVELMLRKKPLIKIIFNISQLAIAVCLASWTFRAFGGTPSTSVFAFRPLAIGGAVAAYFVFNSTAVSIAVALADGIPFAKAWSRIGGASLFYDFVSSPLAAVLAYLYVKYQVPGILAVIIPIWFLRHIYQTNFQLEQVNRDLLELMVKAIEARDPYTSGHSLRVSQIAERLAYECGLGSKLVGQIRTAALLHDVGKIHEDFAPLLRKHAKLEPAEKALMQTHPSRSAELVMTISAFRGPIEAAVRHHHERFDGMGYPGGIGGEAIPLASRIIAIADTIDAMTTDRPYRAALTYDRVVSELQSCAGKQFDPRLVETVLRSDSIRRMVIERVAAQAERPRLELDVFAGLPEAVASA